MARTVSAGPGETARWWHTATPIWLLLSVHLALLSMLALRLVLETSSDIDGPADPALLALASGLMLALIVIVTLRKKQLKEPQGASQSGAASEDGNRPAQAAWTSSSTPAVGCETDDAYAGLMARIGHDLRTPLNALLGFSDLMRSETFGPIGNERYRAYAAHMHSCGLDLLKATESTLAMTALLTKPAQSDRGSTSLLGLIEDARTAAAAKFGETPLAVRTSISAQTMVKADARGMHQALVHLLCAAQVRVLRGRDIEIAAMGSHGRVQLRIAAWTAPDLRQMADTSCRNRTSAWRAIDDLPLSLSRTIFGLQGLLLTESIDAHGRWTAVVNLEDANQIDFFEPRVAAWPPQPVRAAPTGVHSGAFLDGALSASASA